MAEESGGVTGYQTLINAALREYLDGKAPKFEETLRRIIREELKSSAAEEGAYRRSFTVAPLVGGRGGDVVPIRGLDSR